MEKKFKNTIRVSNGLNSDQARCSVKPDLGLIWLQRLSADNKSRCCQAKISFFFKAGGIKKIDGRRKQEGTRALTLDKVLILTHPQLPLS